MNYSQWRVCTNCRSSTWTHNDLCFTCLNVQHIAPAQPETINGTKDGTGAADNDEPYTFGRLPHATAPFPFSTMQFAHLIIQHSKWAYYEGTSHVERSANRIGIEHF